MVYIPPLVGGAVPPRQAGALCWSVRTHSINRKRVFLLEIRPLNGIMTLLTGPTAGFLGSQPATDSAGRWSFVDRNGASATTIAGSVLGAAGSSRPRGSLFLLSTARFGFWAVGFPIDEIVRASTVGIHETIETTRRHSISDAIRTEAWAVPLALRMKIVRGCLKVNPGANGADSQRSQSRGWLAFLRAPPVGRMHHETATHGTNRSQQRTIIRDTGSCRGSQR